MIDHIGIQVADVEASLAFYLRAFGPIGMRVALSHRGRPERGGWPQTRERRGGRCGTVRR